MEIEKEVRPSHLPQDPHWLAVVAYDVVTGEILNRDKFFLSDIDQLHKITKSPKLLDEKIQSQEVTFKDVGLNVEVIKVLISQGEAERIWITPKGKQRRIAFIYRLQKVRHADMLKSK